MRFVRHLAEDTVRDVVIPAPVRCPLGNSELIHIVTIQLASQHFRSGVNFAGTFDKVATPAVKLNLLNFAFGRAVGHDGDKRQA